MNPSQIIDNLILISLSGGVIYFVKYYFNFIHLRISDLQSSINQQITSIDTRLTQVESKYKDILDLVLAKFSNWEDRISNMLAKLNSGQSIDRELSEFKSNLRKDLNSLKIKIEKISLESEAKNHILESNKLSQNFEILVSKIKILEKRLEIITKVVSALNERTRSK